MNIKENIKKDMIYKIVNKIKTDESGYAKIN